MNYKHFTYNQYKKILGNNIKYFFVFSIIRHPLERMVSLYHYNNIKNCSLNNFIGRGGSGIWNNPRDVWRKGIFKPSGGSSMNTMEYFLGESTPFLLEYQNLKNDWKKLFNKLNLPYQELKILNSNNRVDYDSFYRNITIVELIHGIFEKEIQNYFSKDGLNTSSMSGRLSNIVKRVENNINEMRNNLKDILISLKEGLD